MVQKNTIIPTKEEHIKNQGRNFMKTKLILTSLSALLISIAGAKAMEYRPFIGATIGMSGLGYSGATNDAALAATMDLPSDFFTYGIEGGIRLGGYNQIYNGGISMNFDFTNSEKISDTFSNEKLGELKAFAISATYDNYLRLSGDKTSRIDLVLGAGVGVMNYDMGLEDYGENAYSTTLAFKAGLDFELTKHITLSAQGRFFVPTRAHYAVDTNYIIGGAVKYMF